MTKQSRNPAVYILANKRNGTLYTGVTSDLIQRIHQHKEKITDGFSKKHDCSNLVFFEIHETMESAILREKQIKGGSRKKKLALIENKNPEWQDLYEEIIK
ncbi:MAG: GIY-YIG nuclease family protein [Alphaproteobacteria bacterium]|nr:GIY-YIG nuclease family protein [Alphaproteobacteria bacterium]